MHSLLQDYFKMIKQFLPHEQEVSAVGLDIGTGECTLVELIRSGNTFELVHWAIEPILDGNIKPAIENILGQFDVSNKSIYTSISGKGTLIRYIDVPRMSIDDLKSSFAIEADKYFPFAQNQVYTDCYILDMKEKGKQMSVMAAAAKRELIDRRMNLLKELGVSADFISLNPIALVNAFSVLELGDKGDKGKEENSVVALLDMGESVSSLTIFANKLPRFTRDIFVGGQDFTQSISNALEISLAEAEKLKNNPKNRLKEVIRSCDTVVTNMIQELRLSIDYFITEKNCEVHKLLITGGASMLEGITKVFEKDLEVEVSQWNPMSCLKVAENISSKDIEKKSLTLGVALGLALYQYD